jgi:hypothetical protein
MKQQAALLGKHTNNLLEGDVSSDATRGRLTHRFFIKAPTLDYRYEVFRVSHDLISLYPVRVEAGPHKANFTEKDRTWESEEAFKDRTLESEGAFLEWLKEVLNSEDTKRVLGSLLAQSEA